MGRGKDGFWTAEEWEYYSKEVRQMQQEGGELRRNGEKTGWFQSDAVVSEKLTDEQCKELARELQRKQKELSDRWGFENIRRAEEIAINRRMRFKDDM